ncbi:rod shape-determining protein MreC [Candidatus Parcubacteria bacterium]|nr:rod shape-determining protein MreC [Candidatus Parcubacteria bacterium]
MIYPPRDNARRKKKRLVSVGILLGLLVIIILVNVFAPQFFAPVTHLTGLPFLKSRLAATGALSGSWQILSSKRSLIADNRQLQERTILFEALEAERTSLKVENETLRGLLGRSPTSRPIILAQILSKPGFSPYDTLILDAGESDGITVGSLVLINNTLVVGEIVTVTNHTSNALLYSTPEHKTEVFVGPQSLQAVAIGKGGGNFEIRVPRNTEFKQGDEVRLARFPDSVFGSITEVSGAAADTFDRVLFRSLVDIAHIRFVTIEKQP